jgi:aldehyde dehydrogenase (NAD+)
MAGTRTLVHESIYDEFVSKVVGIVESKKFGDPLDPTIDYGP